MRKLFIGIALLLVGVLCLSLIVGSFEIPDFGSGSGSGSETLGGSSGGSDSGGSSGDSSGGSDSGGSSGGSDTGDSSGDNSYGSDSGDSSGGSSGGSAEVVKTNYAISEGVFGFNYIIDVDTYEQSGNYYYYAVLDTDYYVKCPFSLSCDYDHVVDVLDHPYERHDYDIEETDNVSRTICIGLMSYGLKQGDFQLYTCLVTYLSEDKSFSALNNMYSDGSYAYLRSKTSTYYYFLKSLLFLNGHGYKAYLNSPLFGLTYSPQEEIDLVSDVRESGMLA